MAVEPDGRRRVYRLASVEVAEMLEAMQHLAPDVPVTSLRGANTKRRLRRARLCYDHLAGVLGTAVTDALVRTEALRSDSDVLVLGDRAADVLGEVGIDLAPLQAAPRPLLRQCTDWTERRPHVAGGLGAAIAERMLDQRWVIRRPGSRGLDVTVDGADGLGAVARPAGARVRGLARVGVAAQDQARDRVGRGLQVGDHDPGSSRASPRWPPSRGPGRGRRPARRGGSARSARTGRSGP